MRVVAALLGLSVAVAAEPQRQPPPVFEDDGVSVRLQQLYLTVVDEKGRRVPDLGADEIEIVDGDVRQEIVTFERGDVPFTAVLLIDASRSMRGSKLRTALSGAHDFMRGAREYDEVKLLAFNDRIVYETPFSPSPAALAVHLPEIEAGGGTACNDMLYLGLKQLERRQGRRTVILLSDGEDVHSVLSASDVLFKVRHSQALVYWLRLEPRRGGVSGAGATTGQTSGWRDAVGHAREIADLELAVAASGGRIVPVNIEPDIGPAFRDVLEELRSQYVLGYYASNPRHDQAWRRVEVRFSRPGVPGLVRGYIDY